VIEELKKFVLRGNVMDLAVGVIIGAAFGKIVDSLVQDVIMPIVGVVLGKIDFSNLYLILSQGTPAGPYASLDAAKKAGAAVFAYGTFITACVNFLILAVVIFFLVRFMNNLIKKEEAPAVAAPPPPPPEDVVLLREIRDALKRA
jgi:large conductance mechanosensitive channel